MSKKKKKSQSKKKSTQQDQGSQAVTTSSEPKQPRVSKREQRRQEMERQQRQRSLIIWGSVGFVLFLIVGGFAYRLLEPDVEGVVFAETAVGGDHDANITYDFGGLPPMGNTHNPTWQNCGIYTTPVEPQYAIHSMEHGVVWITYNPDIDAEAIAALQDIAGGRNSSRILLSPYPDQTSPIALTTWDIQLAVDSVEDDRIEQFVTRYVGLRGPEAGASCSNGVGVPIRS